MTDTTRQQFRFFHRLRVRWAEVDMQKIVFNAHYLMYFDTAISDYWRALALPYEATFVALQGDLYVKKATLEFHVSARLDDQLEVAQRVDAIYGRHFSGRRALDQWRAGLRVCRPRHANVQAGASVFARHPAGL
jgi:YbgC/YbaW family acyl-CoA thioester hydrolase